MFEASVSGNPNTPESSADCRSLWQRAIPASSTSGAVRGTGTPRRHERRSCVPNAVPARRLEDSRASVAVAASGFSHSTCFPASAARIAHGAQVVGQRRVDQPEPVGPPGTRHLRQRDARRDRSAMQESGRRSRARVSPLEQRIAADRLDSRGDRRRKRHRRIPRRTRSRRSRSSTPSRCSRDRSSNSIFPTSTGARSTITIRMRRKSPPR